jgi:small conductance mechanosensitive channel
MAQGLFEGPMANVAVKIPEIPGLEGLPATVSIRDVSDASGKLLDVLTERALDVALAVILVGAGWMLSRWVASATQRALVRARVEATVASFLGSVARYTLFIMMVVMALSVLGIGLASAVAVFGAIGLALAFALRGTLSHVAAGVMLIVNQPFKVGDWVQMEGLDGVEGWVKRITLFNTEINTLTNQRVFIPNTRIWENTFLNHTYNDTRLVETRVNVGMTEDGARVREVLLAAALSHPNVLATPEPLVGPVEMNGYAMVYTVRVWLKTKDYFSVRFGMAETLRAGLLAAGIGIPYPTQVQINVPHVAGKPEQNKKDVT